MIRVLSLVIVAFMLLGCGTKTPEVTVEGDLKAGEVITISYEGPNVAEESKTFTDYAMWVSFWQSSSEGPVGKQYFVNGYFAGDGNSADSNTTTGKTWEAKLVIPNEGNWFYVVRFIHAPNFAITQSVDDEHADYFIDEGILHIEAKTYDSQSTDFRKKGMLQDVKARYLQFSGTKDYFLKTGAGSPENILAYTDFDGTYDVGGTNFPALGDNQLHEFKPHLKDAREGDPTWGDYKGAAILGIANYYEEVGVNAQYLVTMNVEGDGQDVFPWASHDDPYVYDVSKLAQWQRVFEHFNARGVLIDMLLAETENESWFEAYDGVEVGKDFADSRKLYYREMVARFGHLNGLVFNLGEEHGAVGNSGQDPYRQPTSVEQRRAFAKYIRKLDPYGHAVVSHNWPDSEEETYGALLGEADFSGISMQAHDNYFEKIATWTQKSKAAGRPWMVTVDEPLGWEFGARPDKTGSSVKREIEGVLWPTLMAGGAGIDWYFGWQNNAPTSDLSNEDQRSRHNLWVTSTKVRKFFEDIFDLETLETSASENLLMLTVNGKDPKGRDVVMTAKRSLPIIPEGEGHNPWEYKLESLTLTVEGESRKIDPINPK